MNLEVLQHLVSNERERIEDLAHENNVNATVLVGVAKFLVGNDGDVTLLSPRQKLYYEKAIEPLIENVPCHGIFGDNTCTGDGIIDDESLLDCYLERKFLCQHCRFESAGE